VNAFTKSVECAGWTPCGQLAGPVSRLDATALVTGLPLVTSNLKHFPMFPGLARAY
jgi:hypothetical protein